MALSRKPGSDWSSRREVEKGFQRTRFVCGGGMGGVGVNWDPDEDPLLRGIPQFGFFELQ